MQIYPYTKHTFEQESPRSKATKEPTDFKHKDNKAGIWQQSKESVSDGAEGGQTPNMFCTPFILNS